MFRGITISFSETPELNEAIKQVDEQLKPLTELYKDVSDLGFKMDKHTFYSLIDSCYTSNPKAAIRYLKQKFSAHTSKADESRGGNTDFFIDVPEGFKEIERSIRALPNVVPKELAEASILKDGAVVLSNTEMIALTIKHGKPITITNNNYTNGK